ncbi:hypothetical protein ESCO_004492 [Escovopsis weberi]|uniref:Acyl-CoA thioesterase-like C-terminal domain-containing protein n=1 Tax=Escovopsis weberi TaxID=150374 RepID=A0A0M9VVF9_ESCWE|nr:hypothetical protein ESCO_004492 [Escovopsis weberi]
MTPASSQHVARMSFDEAMALTRLPDSASPAKLAKRFVSHQPPWKPGQDLPKDPSGKEVVVVKRSYGAHVYAQAALAAARVVEDRVDASTEPQGKLGIHTIQGVFTVGGLPDRPFVYEVTDISSSKSFSTQLTTARQPAQPSSRPAGPYPASDADLPLGDIAFTCITTFRRPVQSFAESQPPSAWERFAAVLGLQAPEQWPYSPQIDLDLVTQMPGTAAEVGYGTFPILDLHKVDMRAHNADKPLHERRELILYRLHRPLDALDVNAHVLCHAFEADRNGLLMLQGHMGWGRSPGPVTSLSYAFFVHTNADEAVMRDGEWWLQEACWPRVSAGRGTMECRIWSPGGRHVATAYQDGLCMPLVMKGKM